MAEAPRRADSDGEAGAPTTRHRSVRLTLAAALLIAVAFVSTADQAVGTPAPWSYVPSDGAVLAVGLPTGQYPVIARTTNILDCSDPLCRGYRRTALAVPAESAAVRADGSVLYASVVRDAGAPSIDVTECAADRRCRTHNLGWPGARSAGLPTVGIAAMADSGYWLASAVYPAPERGRVIFDIAITHCSDLGCSDERTVRTAEVTFDTPRPPDRATAWLGVTVTSGALPVVFAGMEGRAGAAVACSAVDCSSTGMVFAAAEIYPAEDPLARALTEHPDVVFTSSMTFNGHAVYVRETAGETRLAIDGELVLPTLAHARSQPAALVLAPVDGDTPGSPTANGRSRQRVGLRWCADRMWCDTGQLSWPALPLVRTSEAPRLRLWLAFGPFQQGVAIEELPTGLALAAAADGVTI